MMLLEQSLCMMKGVSPEAECRLRRLGVLTCRQLADNAERFLSGAHAGRVRVSFREWEVARAEGLVDWMIGSLPAGHRVRVLKEYWNEALFYDIETDGMSVSSGITCISALRGGEMRSFWRGHNLEGFLAEWAKARILVSFNGKRFDTPFVCKTFGLTSVPPQIDLMDEARYYGLRGGLKSIEQQVGFVRQSEGCGDGRDAIRLWNEYETTKDKDVLNTLLAYNRADVASLEHLSRHLLRLSLESAQIPLDGFF